MTVSPEVGDTIHVDGIRTNLHDTVEDPGGGTVLLLPPRSLLLLPPGHLLLQRLAPSSPAGRLDSRPASWQRHGVWNSLISLLEIPPVCPAARIQAALLHRLLHRVGHSHLPALCPPVDDFLMGDK